MVAEPLNWLFQHGEAVMVRRPLAPDAPIEWVSTSILDLIGRDADALMAEAATYLELIHADDRDRFVEESGRYLSGHCRHSDYRLRHADGHWVWVKDNASILIQQDSAVVQSLLVDVTELHTMQARLKEERERLQLVLESTRLGMWDWNPQTNQVVFDERWAEMLGHRLADIPPTVDSWSSRVHPDDLDDAMAAVGAHLSGDTTFYEHVHRVRHKQGHWVWILDRGRVVEWDADGKPVRFTGTHTDISREKQAELHAREANHAKSYFLARMSHEIRTPLNGVLGILQLLGNTHLDAQQSEYVDTIRESGQTLLTIINDVLDVAKIEAGAMQLHAVPFPLQRSLRLVHDLYAETASSKGLAYTLELDHRLPNRVVADDHRLRQVLSNLVANAVKFTDQGKVSMHVTASEVADGRVMLTVRVADTGPGIADPEAVFETFRQESARNFGVRGGTGLGLTISRQLVEAMGGSLTVESRVGQGSTFRLDVPLELADSPAITEAVVEADAPCPPLRILVAEDNQVNTMVIRGILTKLQQEPDLVSNGRQAVEACRRKQYDLVLMDVHMPVMDGLLAARTIARELGSEAPAIVAISADAFGIPESEYRAAGMVQAIAKPFQAKQIDQVLRDVFLSTQQGAPSVTVG